MPNRIACRNFTKSVRFLLRNERPKQITPLRNAETNTSYINKSDMLMIDSQVPVPIRADIQAMIGAVSWSKLADYGAEKSWKNLSDAEIDELRFGFMQDAIDVIESATFINPKNIDNIRSRFWWLKEVVFWGLWFGCGKHTSVGQLIVLIAGMIYLSRLIALLPIAVNNLSACISFMTCYASALGLSVYKEERAGAESDDKDEDGDEGDDIFEHV